MLLLTLATLQAYIVINQDYPRVKPVLAVNVNWKHERNFSNDEAIRDMEREINMFTDNQDEGTASLSKLSRSASIIQRHDERNYDIFSKQINHLLICFDIYLESESYYLNSYEYQRTKLFTSTVRGRDRKRPYSYMAASDLFVQRMKYDSLDI